MRKPSSNSAARKESEIIIFSITELPSSSSGSPQAVRTTRINRTVSNQTAKEEANFMISAGGKSANSSLLLPVSSYSPRSVPPPYQSVVIGGAART